MKGRVGDPSDRLADFVKEDAVGGDAFDADVAGGVEQVDEGVGVIGVEVAADGARGEVGVGDFDLEPAVAVEALHDVGERSVVEHQARRAIGGAFGGGKRGGEIGGGEAVDEGAFAGDEENGFGRGGVGAGDLHLALGDEDFDAGGVAADVEGGANGADGDVAGADDEGAGGVFGDVEVSFTVLEDHAASGGSEGDLDLGGGAEDEGGAVGEVERLVFAGGGGVGGVGAGEIGAGVEKRESERGGGGEAGGGFPKGGKRNDARSGGDEGVDFGEQRLGGGRFGEAREETLGGFGAAEGGGVARIGVAPAFERGGLGGAETGVALGEPDGGGLVKGVVARFGELAGAILHDRKTSGAPPAGRGPRSSRRTALRPWPCAFSPSRGRSQAWKRSPCRSSLSGSGA